MLPPSSLKEFSSSTPCYIGQYNESEKTFSHIVNILKDSGFNITDDKNAPCTIQISGYVTTPSKTAGSVPSDLVFIMNNSDKFSDIGPALQASSNTDTGKIAANASGMSGTQLAPSGINALSQVGNAVHGVNGSAVLVGINTLLDIFSGIHSRQTTPPGVAYINAEVLLPAWFPGSKKHAFVLGAYAASTTPEKPEALIDAGIKRVAQAIWEHTEAYDKSQGIAFTMPTIQPVDAEQVNTTDANGAAPGASTTSSTASATPFAADKPAAGQQTKGKE